MQRLMMATVLMFSASAYCLDEKVSDISACLDSLQHAETTSYLRGGDGTHYIFHGSPEVYPESDKNYRAPGAGFFYIKGKDIQFCELNFPKTGAFSFTFNGAEIKKTSQKNPATKSQPMSAPKKCISAVGSGRVYFTNRIKDMMKNIAQTSTEKNTEIAKKHATCYNKIEGSKAAVAEGIKARTEKDQPASSSTPAGNAEAE